MKNKMRIIETTSRDGSKYYEIERHGWFFWSPVYEHVAPGTFLSPRFETLEEAQANLCKFDGTPSATYRVVMEVEDK